MRLGLMKRMLLGCSLMVAVAGFAACGADDKTVAQGKVVKGPVIGAQVFDVNNVHFADTDATGSYPLTNTGPYRTVGGTYTPLDAQGHAGAPVAAPPMKAPAGVAQITPLSTLVASAAPADQTKILATLQSLGVTLSTDFSVKTAANTAALVLSESVGAMLQQAAANTGANAAATSVAVTNALISAVANLPPSTITAPTATNLTSALTSAVTTAASTNTDLAAISATLETAASTAAQGAASAPVGALPVPTGSTGGTGTNGLK